MKVNFIRLLVVIAVVLWGQPMANAADSNAQAFKVGFLCVGSINDAGWNAAHNKGRLYLESKMSNVKTTFAERIPENAEAERVLEKMIAQGNKLIFTTSYGFLEPALRVAARHPDVTFMQVNRFDTAKNLGTYFSHQYQPLYLAGVVAGKMTKTNKLGFLGAHPVPPLLQAANAFTLGARSVNPKVVTKVVWIGSWTDPPTEAEAMKGLVESGVDVIGHIQDNQNTILKTAESLGIYSVGCYNDAHELAPKGWLTGACLDWGPLYVKITKSVMDHTWKSGCLVTGMDGGYIKLAAFGNAVPAKLQKEVTALEQDIKSGKLVVFQAPLEDREGKQRLTAGQKPDIKWLTNMDFFVSGIEGSLPKK
jgi:basic membrane protein A and related proteins